jgi:hypothetical protein
MGDAEKVIRVIGFGEEVIDWPVWEENFLARSRRKGYKKIIFSKATVSTDMEFEALSEAPKRKAKELRDLNELAYEDLILSIDGKEDSGQVTFNIVKGCRTSEYEDRNARLVWTRLKAKYASQSAPSRMKLVQEFAQSRLANVNNDPNIWLTQFEDLCTRIDSMSKRPMEDEDFYAHMLNNLPKEYMFGVATLEQNVATLKIGTMREKFNLTYQRLHEAEPDEPEAALFAGGFKGRCHQCGKYGHKVADCENLFCRYCKKDGHVIKDCPSLKAKEERENDTTEIAF